VADCGDRGFVLRHLASPPALPPVATTCAEMQPICLSDSLYFPGATSGTAEVGNYPQCITDGVTCITGNDYGCLDTQPAPSWWYLDISTPGAIITSLLSATNEGTASDVDFAIWGPFSSLSAAKQQCGSMPAPHDCGYSSSASETPTLSGAQQGEVYVLMITNFAQTAQEISFTKTGGNGDTDCSAAQTEAWPEPALYMHPRCCSQNMFMPPDMPTVLWEGRPTWEHIALQAVQYPDPTDFNTIKLKHRFYDERYLTPLGGVQSGCAARLPVRSTTPSPHRLIAHTQRLA